MYANKLPNYLKTYRRRSGLNQGDLAYLLGTEGKNNNRNVSRYECSTRFPNIRTLLAYEAIFDVPVHQLYAGIYEEVRERVEKRAKSLLAKLRTPSSKRNNEITLRKVEFLKGLCRSEVK